MVGLPDGEKTYMCNRLGTIPACDRQTDGHLATVPQHSPRYAYASRGKNEKLHWTDSKFDRKFFLFDVIFLVSAFRL